jgi:hypothetical protein
MALLLAGGAICVLLATANGGGYRYGTSDQAFYIPVVLHALDPSAFPRDASLIDAQGRLMLTDELLAGIIGATGVSMEILFLGGYLLSMGLLWSGLLLIGRSIAVNRWVTVALAAAFTLRHRIPRTSANSFEPYFHPRMLAFSVGVLALAAVLRRRPWTAILLTGVAALVHATTATWFGVLIGVALAVLDVRFRRLAAGATVAAAAFAAWTVTAGPLRASMTTMDAVWLEAIAGKDSLFATQWPIWTWTANLGMVVVLWWAHRRRHAHALARPEDTALVWGATALAALFLITLPAVAARAALPVQLQIPRVFWLVDLVATIYVIGAIRSARVAAVLAAALLALSTARGVYVLAIEHPERPLFGVHLTDSPWEAAMRWLRQQPLDTHVLADSGHAWKYGTSVRVSAQRDVFVEDVKDSAIAIYSREVAVRYVERMNALGDFGALTPEHALDLGRQYDLDYLVTEAEMTLPLAFRNEQFRIYALKSSYARGPSLQPARFPARRSERR